MRDQGKRLLVTRSFKTKRIRPPPFTRSKKSPRIIDPRGVVRRPGQQSCHREENLISSRESIFLFFPYSSSAALLASESVSEKTRVVVIIRALAWPFKRQLGVWQPSPRQGEWKGEGVIPASDDIGEYIGVESTETQFPCYSITSDDIWGESLKRGHPQLENQN